jgi:hypothetical protein
MRHTSGSSGALGSQRRQTFIRLGVVASLATVGLVASAGSTGADGVPAHDHFLVTPSGSVVQIGPHVCDHPDELHEPFHNFHAHVHTGSPTKVGGLTIRVEFC